MTGLVELGSNLDPALSDTIVAIEDPGLEGGDVLLGPLLTDLLGGPLEDETVPE